MATVTNTIKLPDGTTPTNAAVEIELVASTTSRAAGWVTATDVTLLSVARPTVTAGAWTASLTPNADITPSGTVYKVTEYADRHRYIHYISVGSGGGSVHDLLVDAPASLASAALTDHIADTSGAHAASAVSVLDAAGNFSATDVEAALTELAPALSGLTSSKPGPGLRWVFVGDSITNGSTATNSSYSFPSIAIQAAGYMVARPDSHEAGTPGETTAQMLARLDTVLAYTGIEAMVLLGGTNDAGAGVTLSTFAANIQAMVTAAKRKNLPVVLCTVPPRSSAASTSIHYSIIAYNQWIKTHAPRLGCEVADTYSVLVDTTTGYLSTSYDTDGTHPNDLGHSRMGQKVAAAMIRAAGRATPYGLITAKHPGIITPDPLVVGGSTKPASWFEQPGGTGSTPTYSLVSDTSGVLPAGRWSQIDITAASATVRRHAAAVSATSSGDTVLLCCHVQVDDVSGDWETNVAAGTASIVPLFVDNSGVNKAQAYYRCPGMGTPGGTNNFGPVVLPYVTTAAYAGILWISCTVPSGSHYTFRVGCVGVMNASTLGLASEYSWATNTILVNH